MSKNESEKVGRKPVFHPTNGREGETATFSSRCPLNSNGLGGGFAPRHLNRWVLSCYNRNEWIF
ncbi:MAG: hypothetical protein M3367_12000 [Acidobacteriota bacterium]|nr:hypothetical protein [Acidobacteriota bacterium]